MSQNEMVMEYMQKNGSITTWEAITALHITRLSARIKNLRDAGVGINDTRHYDPETGARWTEYFLA